MFAESPLEPTPRSAPDGEGREPPSIPDPYLKPGGAPPPERPRLSMLAVSSVAIVAAQVSLLAVTSIIALFFGPLGAIAAIVFGWAARRDIERSGSRRTGYGIATVGLALGALATVGWGAALSLKIYQHRAAIVESIAATPAAVATPAPSSSADPVAPAPPAPIAATGVSAPKTTALKHEGKITVVDVGVSATALDRELAKQRADASTAGETVLVMLTRETCDPCRGVDGSLNSILMQTALAKVRLVRVDIEAFKDDLDSLKMPRERYPAFFLLGVDLMPRDGIDGGEWDDDIAQNIAPVLGAFVRGKYGTRRQTWHPLPGSGVSL